VDNFSSLEDAPQVQLFVGTESILLTGLALDVSGKRLLTRGVFSTAVNSPHPAMHRGSRQIHVIDGCVSYIAEKDSHMVRPLSSALTTPSLRKNGRMPALHSDELTPKLKTAEELRFFTKTLDAQR
jgi:hypothetical protein